MGRSEVWTVSVSLTRSFLRRGIQLVAVLVAGVGVAVVVGIYAENTDNPLVPSGRWLGWIGSTVLLGAFVIHDHRNSWRRISFWLAVAGLFAGHTALYALAFQLVATWRGAWFLPITLAEYPIFLLALHWLGYGDDPNVRRRAP